MIVLRDSEDRNLKGAEKRTLAAKGEVKVTVKVAFVATDGAKTTKTVKVTLK